MSDNPLRKRAAKLTKRPGYKGRIDLLIESLDDDTRANVLDLLTGEPLVSHSPAAAVLQESFGDQLGGPILARHVMEWRRSRSIYMRGAEGDK
jgi:hypothetical protein